MSSAALPPRHFLLALAVVAVWGTNFVIIKVALAHFPPLLFATLRFALAALPGCSSSAGRPVGWRYLAAFGVLLGVGQFGLLFIAMRVDISPGLASLVIQSAGVLHRRPVVCCSASGAAAAIAGAGARRGRPRRDRREHRRRAPRPRAWRSSLVAALSWAAANLVSAARRPGRCAGLHGLVERVRGAAAAGAVRCGSRGRRAIVAALAQRRAAAWAAVLWQSLGNTLFGFGAGTGCWRATRPRRSRRWRCWCRCSASRPPPGGWASRCRRGSSSPPRSSSAGWR